MTHVAVKREQNVAQAPSVAKAIEHCRQAEIVTP